MNGAVVVAVDVIEPVPVAALVNGNDAVAVTDAVNEQATSAGRGRYRRACCTFEKLDVAMECAADLDVMKIDELIENDLYEPASTRASWAC